MNNKSILFLSKTRKKIVYLILLSLVYSFLFPQLSWAHLSAPQEIVLAGNHSPALSPTIKLDELLETDPLIILQGHTIVQTSNPLTPITPAATVAPTVITAISPAAAGNLVTITAYSSSPDETYGDPFITASGARVRDGIIACNFLKFGTKVQIPSLFGDKIFVVKDRMARKNSHKVDIWMPSKAQALQFGVKRAEIVVLEN